MKKINDICLSVVLCWRADIDDIGYDMAMQWMDDMIG